MATDPERAFDVVLPEPLTRFFGRRYGPFPPIRDVRDQGGVWGQIGQSRAIVLSDSGRLREILTSIHRPSSFSYRIDQVTGPMGSLVSGIEGRWLFEPVGAGCRITWAWTLHPRNRLAGLVIPVLGRLRHGYARQALEEVERVLVG